MLKKVIIYCIILIFLGCFLNFADERDYPIDIIIALDKSLSMTEEIDAVKDYINSAIVDDKLQKDDYFLVVSFFGKSTVAVSTKVEGEEHKKLIKQYISTIQADGHFTDIGRALDAMKYELETNTDDTRQKYLLLITDGMHNPEPGSEYFSEDGTISHEFLKNVDETQKDGWKIIVIGIGEHSAKDIAEQFNAEYVETSDEVTTEELERIVPEGMINVTGKIELSPVDIYGNSTLTVPYKTSLYNETPEISISSIQINTPVYIPTILPRPYSTQLIANDNGILEIPVIIRDMEPGEYNCDILINFTSKETFQEEHTVFMKVNTIWEAMPWLLPLIIAVGVIIVVLLVLLVLRLAKGKALKFRLIVEEYPLGKGKDVFTARKGKEQFLKETMDMFDIVPKKTRKCLAKLAATDKGLRMTVLDETRFPDLIGKPDNVIGKKFVVRTEKGFDCNIRFVKI